MPRATEKLAVQILRTVILFVVVVSVAGKAKQKRGTGTQAACAGVPKKDLKSYDLLIQRAAELSGSGALDDAQACIETAIPLATKDNMKAHALFNLAVILRQKGQIGEALKTLKQAPSSGIQNWAAANQFLGLLHLETDDAPGALRYLTQTKRLNPAQPSIYRDMAQAYYNLGQVEPAVDVWREGIANLPGHAEGWFNLGLLLREIGGKYLAESEKSYKTSIRLDPDSARARYSYANMLYDSMRLREAAAMYSQALRIDPTHEDAMNNLGNALRQSGQLVQARAVFERGLESNPRNTNFLLNGGQVYQDLGLVELTARVAEAAYEIRPGLMEASVLLGSVAYSKGELEEAIRHYRRASELDPGAHQPLLNLANTLGDLYRHKEAKVSNQNEEAREAMLSLHRECVGVYEQMLRRDAKDGEALLHMLWAKKYACEWDEWDVAMARLQAAVREQLQAGKAPSLKPFIALAFPISPALYLDIAVAHAEEERAKAAKLLPVLGQIFHPLQLQQKRLRIAYMSTDLGDHPVGHQAWFWAHDSARVDVVLLALSHNDGSEWWTRTSRMVPDGNFVELGKLNKDISSVQVGRLVNDRQVQVLITLNGWTSGNQVDVLAMRPAPIQVEYMGSHDSLGASFVDLFVSDQVATPPEFQGHFAERLLLTPHSFFMNEYARSRAHIPPVADGVSSGRLQGATVEVAVGEGGGQLSVQVRREAHGLPPSGFLLSNFNQLFKVDPAAFGVWMRVLTRVPDAYLWLLRLPSTAEAALREEAQRHGGDLNRRIIFSDRLEWRTHLIVKALANMSVDNPVFNAHTSGVDSLWAGVPLVTTPGETMSSRVAASLLLSGPPSASSLGGNGIAIESVVSQGERLGKGGETRGRGDGHVEVAGEEQIARTLQDYEETVTVLSSAAKRSRLARLRATMAGGRAGAELFDTALMVRTLERGLSIAWDTRALKPSHLQLPFHAVVSRKQR